jgi:hypothetical protein
MVDLVAFVLFLDFLFILVICLLFTSKLCLLIFSHCVVDILLNLSSTFFMNDSAFLNDIALMIQTQNANSITNNSILSSSTIAQDQQPQGPPPNHTQQAQQQTRASQSNGVTFTECATLVHNSTSLSSSSSVLIAVAQQEKAGSESASSHVTGGTGAQTDQTRGNTPPRVQKVCLVLTALFHFYFTVILC